MGIAPVQGSDGSLIIIVSGSLDTAAAADFEQALLALLANTADRVIRLDLTEVGYLNSRGAEAIARVARHDKRIVLTGLSAQARRILDLLDSAPPMQHHAGRSAR